jgi:hypothetical protein
LLCTAVGRHNLQFGTEVQRELSSKLREKQGLKTTSSVSASTVSEAGGSLLFDHLKRLKIKYF